MKLKILILTLFLFISCKNQSNQDFDENVENATGYVEDNTNEDIKIEEDEDVDSETDESDEEIENETIDGKITDGTYDASVDYYNPKTGYSATYDLEVDVEDGEVVKVNFPKGGWLDDDIHPSESRLRSEELDEYGEATLEDSNGRTFRVKINNQQI